MIVERNRHDRRSQLLQHKEMAIMSMRYMQVIHIHANIVVMQAAVQALIAKLEPLFPEIAGMGVSSDGLLEAIHGCELRLVHAHEAALVSMYFSEIAVADCKHVS